MKIADLHTSAVSLVKEALEKAKKYASHNIFISLNEDEALKKAAEIDQKIQNGEKVGRLAGVPYALKDNFLSKQGNTTAASKILSNLHSPIDSTTVAKLEAEGAIMIGRTNLDAFAHGSSTENSYFGPTHNAKDFERVADTGGSIRQPASFNGVYGLKPTYGTISRYGVVAMASSTDVIGFFTQNPEDLDLLMSITSGQDEKDLTSLPDYYNETIVETGAKKRIGVIKDFDNENVAPEIREGLKSQIEKLKSEGHEIVELSMPVLKYALAVYYVVVPAEVASNLSRYDGIRYGYRSSEAHSIEEVFGLSRNDGFMPENKRRIMIGNFVLSSGFYDAYYLKAQKVRTLIIKAYEEAFEKCDYILTPVSPSPAFKLGEKVNDPVAMYLEDVMSVPINLAGLPSLAIPINRDKDELPVGLQLIGPRRSDKNLLQFAKENFSWTPQFSFS